MDNPLLWGVLAVVAIVAVYFVWGRKAGKEQAK
jgi:hypothetical protein